jgi:hypothetical protein
MLNLLDKLAGSDEPFLTTREIAKKLKVSERAVCDWARRYQDFPSIALPGSLRVRLSEVADWLEQFQKAKEPIDTIGLQKGSAGSMIQTETTTEERS